MSKILNSTYVSSASNRSLTDKDAALAKEFALRFKSHSSYFPFFVSHAQPQPSSYSFPFYGFGLGGDRHYNNYYYGADKNYDNSQLKVNSKKENEKSSFGFWMAATVITTLAAYVIYTIPTIYHSAKEWYFLRQIKRISNKKSNNPHEVDVIKNLKALIKADKSGQTLRKYNVRMLGALGLIASSGSYMASTIGNFAGELNNFIIEYFPKFMQPSNKLLEKTANVLTDDNLRSFAKASVGISVALVAINELYNLYKDFFYETENPKIQLNDIATRIENSLDYLKNGSKLTFNKFTL